MAIKDIKIKIEPCEEDGGLEIELSANRGKKRYKVSLWVEEEATIHVLQNAIQVMLETLEEAKEEGFFLKRVKL